MRVTSPPDRPTRRRTARRLSRPRAPRTAALDAKLTMAGTSMAQARRDRTTYWLAAKSKSQPVFWASASHTGTRSGCRPRL